MADTFRITQEIEFFDVDNYEERAATFESLHSTAERSIRDDRIRRSVVLVGAMGFLALFWNVLGGPGAEAQASSEALVAAPSEIQAAQLAQLAGQADIAPAALSAPAPAPVVRFATGPSPWGVAKGFDVLTVEPEEPLVAELSDNLLTRLAAPKAAAPAPKPVARPVVKRVARPIAKRVTQRAEPREEAPRKAARPSRSATLELAVTLHDEGRSDEALRELRRLGAHPEALVLKGSIYQDKGDPVAAREVYEQYLKRYPRGGHAATVRSVLLRL